MATGFFYSKSGVTAGAPNLTNAPGSLLTVLDWIFDVDNTNSRKVASKVYTGTNKAVYRFDAVGTIRHYLRVDDSTGATAAVRSYESMSDVDTGVDPYPTFAQVDASTFFWHKSNGAGNRTWRAIVTDRTLQFLVSWNNNGPDDGRVAYYSFGEFQSLDPLDTYCSLITGVRATDTGLNSQAQSWLGRHLCKVTDNQGEAVFGVPNVIWCGAFARSWDGLVKSRKALLCATVIATTSNCTQKEGMGAPGVFRLSQTNFGGFPITPIYIRDVNQTEGVQSTAEYQSNTTWPIRVKVPHLYCTTLMADGIYPVSGSIITIGGTQYEMIPIQGNAYNSGNGILALMIENDEPGLP